MIFVCRELQENLIRSHAAGVGKALTPEKTRMLLALRINVLAKGYSGIKLGTLKQLIDAFNGKNCLLFFFCITITHVQSSYIHESVRKRSVENWKFPSFLLGIV